VSRLLLRTAVGLLTVFALVGAGIAGAATPQPTVAGSGFVGVGGDSDGDALLDDWETNGYDADGDGTIDVDLPAMGADPAHKDVFVEMDYMGAEATCPCHLPLGADLKRIVKAFAKSPRADNPDGTRGIAIHLDAGSARGDAYDLGGGNLVAHDSDLNPVEAEFDAIKAANFDPDRARIFHYMVWAHNYEGGSSSGLSFGIGADSFIVTLGSWPSHGSSNAKVGTFIHELGHNLGLRHGGDQNRNYKPNYLSLMTYAFQIDGVPRTDGGPAYFGYSKAELKPLAESALVESDGLDDRRARSYRTKWWCPSGVLATTPGSANDPIDWNCNASIGGTVSVDANGDDAMTSLTGFRDWGNLVFDGGTIGAGAADVRWPSVNSELTLEKYLRLGAG
jgi:hypothetical protein